MQFSDAQKSYIKQRQSPRQRENRRAWVDADDGSRPLTCTLWDISGAGVRFTIETPSRVPFEFFLILTKDSKDRRRCRVVWRSDDQVGACFLPPPSLS